MEYANYVHSYIHYQCSFGYYLNLEKRSLSDEKDKKKVEKIVRKTYIFQFKQILNNSISIQSNILSIKNILLKI